MVGGSLWAAGWGLVGGTALAGEAQLDVWRGRAALELEQYGAARDRAVEALEAEPTNPEAHQLYVDATAAAGLGTQAVYELAPFDVQTPPWYATRETLVTAIQDGDWRPIRDATEQLLASFETRPDLLLPLWSTDLPKVAKLRRRVLEALVHPDALAASDLEVLYAVRELAVASGDPAARTAVTEVLAARGEPAPAPRPPLDRLGRTELAHDIAEEPVPALPWCYPAELVDVALHVEATLLKARRYRHVALLWGEVQRTADDPTAWTHEARAWLLEGDLDKAARSAETAVWRAARPRNLDLAGTNAEAQRMALAEAFLTRSAVAEARGALPAALGDFGTSALLAGRVLDDKLGERLDRGTLAAVQGTAAAYGGALPAKSAIAAANRTTEADPARALGMLSDARFLATVGTSAGRTLAATPEVYADLYAAAFLSEADAELKQGRIEAARTAAVIATLLAGKTQPYAWATRGSLHDRSGEYDAAFAAWAVARGLGVPNLDADLERTYTGLGPWKLAADVVGGVPPEKVAVKGPILTETAPRPTRPRTDRPSSAPRLGEAFPAFAIDTGYGRLTNASLRGRVAVIVFWDGRCAECLQMLPAFGALARRLRSEGRDAMVVGVSVDDDPAAFERVYLQGQRWAELVWAPGLRVPFAVDALPTTWVLDPDGVARYFVDHWLSVEELETAVRALD